MKLEEKDLREKYQSSIRKNPAKDKDCPEMDVLIRSFSPELSGKEKFNIIDHISECGACFKKFEAIRQILKESKQMADRLEGISLSKAEVKKLKQRAKNKIRELEAQYEALEKPGFKAKLAALLRPRVSLRYITAFAGILIVIIGAFLIFKAPQIIKKDTLRGREEPSIQLICPKGTLEKLPVIFEWGPFAEAEAYQIYLLDEELTRIWISEKTKSTEAPLPSNLYDSLEKEETYYWKVVCFLKDGTEKESVLQEFKIINNPGVTN